MRPRYLLSHLDKTRHSLLNLPHNISTASLPLIWSDQFVRMRSCTLSNFSHHFSNRNIRLCLDTDSPKSKQIGIWSDVGLGTEYTLERPKRASHVSETRTLSNFYQPCFANISLNFSLSRLLKSPPPTLLHVSYNIKVHYDHSRQFILSSKTTNLTPQIPSSVPMIWSIYDSDSLDPTTSSLSNNDRPGEFTFKGI